VFALAAATLLASVFCRQTRDAVLALYILGLLAWLFVWLIGGPLDYFNPIFVFQPAWVPLRNVDFALLAQRLIGSFIAWGTLGTACLVVAVWQLRPVYIRELESRDSTGTFAPDLRLDYRTLGVVFALIAVGVGLLHAVFPLGKGTLLIVTAVLMTLGFAGLLVSGAAGRALARA